MLVKVKPPNFSSKKVILRIWYRCRVRYLISIFSFIRHKSYELLYFFKFLFGHQIEYFVKLSKVCKSSQRV